MWDGKRNHSHGIFFFYLECLKNTLITLVSLAQKIKEEGCKSKCISVQWFLLNNDSQNLCEFDKKTWRHASLETQNTSAIRINFPLNRRRKKSFALGTSYHKLFSWHPKKQNKFINFSNVHVLLDSSFHLTHVHCFW